MAGKKTKSKIIKMQPTMSLSKYIKSFGRTLKIREVLWTDNMFGSGKGNIIVAREKRNGDIITGSFLVDIFCLGVKDTHFKQMTKYEYEEFKEYLVSNSPLKVEPVDPNYAFNIIYGAVEYAEDLGLASHKDFVITEYLLDAPEDIEYEDIEFGQNGKPCYYHYDGDSKGDIIKKLNDAVGPDGYTFIDGQPFSDEIDANYDKNPFSQLAQERFKNESDRAAFLLFTEVVLLLDRNFENEIEKLEDMLHDNPTAILKIISEGVFEDEQLRGDQIFNDLLISATEKYVMYQTPGFIFDDIYLDAFDSQSETVINSIANINMSLVGDEKVLALMSVLITMQDVLTGSTLIPTDLRDLLDEFVNESTDHEYPVDMVLNYLSHHEFHFGPIDFGSIELESE